MGCKDWWTFFEVSDEPNGLNYVVDGFRYNYTESLYICYMYIYIYINIHEL